MATFRAELVSAYVVSMSRVGAWAVVSGVVAREWGAGAFGGVSAGRAAVTLVGSVGVAMLPVLVGMMADAARHGRDADVARDDDGVLGYERGGGRAAREVRAVFGTGLLLAVGMGLAVAGLLGGVAMVWGLTRTEGVALAMMAGGMLARVVGDVGGAVLQSHGRLIDDNAVVVAGEWAWPALLVSGMLWKTWVPPGVAGLELAALAFLLAGLMTMLGRLALATKWVQSGGDGGVGWDGTVAWSVTAGAGLLFLGTLADFCYAPLTQVRIAGNLDAGELATYAAAVQVDGAMLLLTGAVGAVILPRSARALARGEKAKVLREYWVSTGVCLGAMTVAATAVWLLAEPLVSLWLGPRVAGLTGLQTVVGLVLIHTVLGAGGGVGRAVILAGGKFRTYVLVSMAFGLVNAVAVWIALSGLGWGVPGVVAVTVVTVAARCVVWMPWYVQRMLRQ